MEVLLLSDLPGIGKKNDLLVVQNGFALNHLLPARKAIVVTPNVRKRYAEQIKRRALEREQERAVQESAAKALAGKTLQISAKSAKGGKLYAAVTEKMLADALKKQFSLTVTADQVQVNEPIKLAGTHSITLELGHGRVQLPVEVKAMEEAKKVA